MTTATTRGLGTAGIEEIANELVEAHPVLQAYIASIKGFWDSEKKLVNEIPWNTTDCIVVALERYAADLRKRREL